MKLMSNGTTPFGRKVRMSALVKGVWPRIELVMTDPNVPVHPELSSVNPIGKVPALILTDGSAIYDSAVICEYIDSLAPSPRLIPAEGGERWKTLTLAALADGILEAAVAIVYENRLREEPMRSKLWVDRQQSKIERALAHLEAKLAPWSGTPDYGTISVATALGYLDLRQGGTWRQSHPGLVAWLDAFARDVPAFDATRPPPA